MSMSRSINEHELFEGIDTPRSLFPHKLSNDIGDQLKAAKLDLSLDDLGH